MIRRARCVTSVLSEDDGLGVCEQQCGLELEGEFGGILTRIGSRRGAGRISRLPSGVATGSRRTTRIGTSTTRKAARITHMQPSRERRALLHHSVIYS
jgi:hypothetical protein